jgi:hypothetical protein
LNSNEVHDYDEWVGSHFQKCQFLQLFQHANVLFGDNIARFHTFKSKKTESTPALESLDRVIVVSIGIFGIKDDSRFCGIATGEQNFGSDWFCEGENTIRSNWVNFTACRMIKQYNRKMNDEHHFLEREYAEEDWR